MDGLDVVVDSNPRPSELVSTSTVNNVSHGQGYCDTVVPSSNMVSQHPYSISNIVLPRGSSNGQRRSLGQGQTTQGFHNRSVIVTSLSERHPLPPSPRCAPPINVQYILYTHSHIRLDIPSAGALGERKYSEASESEDSGREE